VQQGVRVQHADPPRPGRQPHQLSQPRNHLAEPATRVSVDARVADLKGEFFPDQAVQQLFR
jgi:hypothetical protein